MPTEEHVTTGITLVP